MATATKKNSLLQAWSKTLKNRSGDSAVFTPAAAVARRFCDIEEESLRLEQMLCEFPSGSVLAIQIGNSISWPALLIAAFRRGLIPLPLGRHVEKGERDLVLQGAGAACLVEADEQDVLSISALQGSGSPLPAVDCDFLKLTSGTTSAPRMIRFQADQLLADCTNVCDTMGIGPDDINFGVIPFSHSYGFSNLITPLLCRGVPLVASDDRMPRAILNGLAATRATVFPGMPVFFDKFAGLNNIPSLEALRLCISAGAPLSKAAGERFTSNFGLKIHSFYGTSECGGIAYDASDEAVYEEGFLGEPMQNVQIDLREDGTICIRSAAVGEGYYPQPEPVTLGDGRFIPSDLISQTSRGMVLVGRASDIINVAGRKLNPIEVESQLLAFPGVRQAVVFGIPSPLRNEEPVACIAGAVDGKALHQFAQTRLSSWQMPKDFWFVEEIPANERGKISRRDLATKYLKEFTK
jgi:acyl-coenzyme A synthetase/AMP-(fatty) acid ligase